MTNKTDVTNATVTILLDINGNSHLVAMKKEKYEAVSLLVKASAETAIKTERTTAEIIEFLGAGKYV